MSHRCEAEKFTQYAEERGDTPSCLQGKKERPQRKLWSLDVRNHFQDCGAASVKNFGGLIKLSKGGIFLLLTSMSTAHHSISNKENVAPSSLGRKAFDFSSCLPAEEVPIGPLGEQK